MNIKLYKKLKLRYDLIKEHPLTKSEISQAMFRYLFFNITQNFNLRPRIYNWIDGLKFYAEKGDAGIVGNIYYKLMDYEDSMFLINVLKPSDLFIDVGANLGHFTLLASGISKVHSIAIEPIESTLQKLKRNIELNNLQNKVSILGYGVGDKNETLNFYTNKTAMNSVSLSENQFTSKIEVRTLDELLKNEHPTFIKIDVEGFEYNVIMGATNILKKTSLKYMMIEFNNSGVKYGFNDEDVFQLILDYNFVPIKYSVESKKITILKSYNKDKFNTLFIRKDLINE